MKLNVLFIITGILGLFFGIVQVIIPGQFSDFYGGTLTDAGKFNGQLIGAAYIGIALLLFLVTKSSDAKARQAIVIGSLVHFVIGLAISLRWQLLKVVNAWGWTTVGLFALLSLGYLYFLVTKKTD